MNSDDHHLPVEPEAQPPREMPLRKMWLFASVGAVAVIVALVMAPTNPGGWVLLASLGGLGWVTRMELRRRKTAQEAAKRSEPAA